MYLAEGKNGRTDIDGVTANIDAAISKWDAYPASTISHHGSACCDIAREWITGFDFSQLNAGHPLTGPRWLRKLFKWGPMKWPIHWCEAVREKTLDCGALGALSHQLLLERGVRSFATQFILEFSDVSIRHWTASWGAAGCDPHWISDGLIYHEGCAVAVNDNELKLWDATATWWVNPRQFGGYAGVVAVRVFDPAPDAGTAFTWGEHRIPANTWHKLQRTPRHFRAANSEVKPSRKRRPRAVKKVAVSAVIA